MTRPALLTCSLKKELRALAVPWLACLATIAAAAVLGGRWRGLVQTVYVLSAAALGALSIGHEYSHRTITLLLSQPVRRQRLLIEKLSVLGVLLLTLFAAAILLLFYATGLRSGGGHSSERAALLLLPVLCGFLLAPWLTMLCRSAVAGAVFSLAIPGLLLTLGEVLGVLKYGRASVAEDFRMAIVWGGTLSLCAVGGVMGWRTFMRLEAIEGSGPDVQLPRWLRRSGTVSAAPGLTKRDAVWLLVEKELRLQQLPLALSALYLVAWAAVASLRYLAPELREVFNFISFFYCGLLSMLIGSLACAEERQMGTLEWQSLLPMATSKQWAVKVGVVLSLALVLALGLPMLLADVEQLLPPGLRLEPLGPLMLAVIVLTTGGLYVSSLCGSGLWALLMSLPAMLAVIVFVRVVTEPLGAAAFTTVLHLSRVESWRLVATLAVQRSTTIAVGVLLTAGLLAVVLRFALANQRSADRAPVRVLKQVIGIAACLTIAQTLLALAVAFHVVQFVPRGR